MPAFALSGDLLTELFLRLTVIDGPSRQERQIADEVSGLLRPAGVQVNEDDAGSRLHGSAGNLICLPPGFQSHAPAIMLSAHLDTVQSTAALRPVVEGGRIRSSGNTILGADNRLGVTVLCHLLLDIARRRQPHRNFFVAFTVCEELGMYGAGHLEVSGFNVSSGFVFDCSQRPGAYIRECAGSKVFQVKTIGKAAHAGVAPEQGVNAIWLASQALAKIETGRIDADTVVNIGTIHGGTATNVVPDEVIVEGEVRAFSPQQLHHRIQAIREAFEQSIHRHGSLKFDAKEVFSSYVLAPDSLPVLRLERALRRVGLSPSPIRYMGGSDANLWNARGIPAVNIGIGAQKPHSFEEFVLIEDLTKSAQLALALVEPE
jgi:tripeptide aminopeptidase